MDVELIEIQEFLASHPPFDRLESSALAQLPRQIQVRYLRRGTPFPPESPADAPETLFVIRRGAIELRRDKELVGKLAEGDLFDNRCRADSGDAGLAGDTVEDTLLYAIPCTEVERLRHAHPAFGEQFEHSVAERLRKALDQVTGHQSAGSGRLMTVTVRDLLRREAITAAPDISIRDAARMMTEHRVSALLLKEQDQLVGIITDRDLRNRCIAAGLATDRPAREIMTTSLCTVDADTLGFQALIQMTRLNVHHLPVTDGDALLGMLSTTDFTRFQSTSAVYLVGDITKANGLDDLVAASARIPDLQLQLVNSGATGSHVGQAVSAITDAITRRLIELAEAELGPPPVPYAWLVGGSQARREQSSHSDQDNALLMSDAMRPEHDQYFRALAERVNDGLNACGYIYCPGEVMAKTQTWRQPLNVWRGYFEQWIERPEPKALMLASVFFDLRALHDPAGLFNALHAHILDLSQKNRIFIAYMAANALKYRPPIGFFRNFVLIHGGDHNQTFDIKHRGTVPIIDLARVYTLSAGLAPINTVERLEAAATSKALSRNGSANLIDAYELISTLRIRHQATQIRRGEKADNFLAPEQLSPLERSHLKDAFRLIDTMQESLGQRYQAGRFA